VDHLVEQAKEMQRQEQSRIIVPGANIADQDHPEMIRRSAGILWNHRRVETSAS